MVATARAATLAPPEAQPFTARMAGAGSLRNELEALLTAAARDSTADDYRRLLITDNVAGKGSVNQRDWMWKRLKLRYALDSPETAEFKAFRWAIEESAAPAERGVVAALMMARTDRLFREIATDLVAPSVASRGVFIDADQVKDRVEAMARDEGLSWSANSIHNIASHILSSLKDFGILAGSRQRRTVGIRLTPVAATFAAFLGRAQGLTDRQLLDSAWFKFLGVDTADATASLHAAARAGLVTFRIQADVVELHLPDLGAAA